MVPDLIPIAAPIIGDAEREAVDRVLRSGMIAGGVEVSEFEAEFRPHVSRRECVAVSSGTAALHLGLLAAGIGPGDEVIVPSFSFAATANAVAVTGATPVFADIERDSYCLSPAAAKDAITSRTVGILPVHLYGHPADMDSLTRLADQHGLAVFEDAAQAHAAAIRDRPAGTFGSFAAFSFYSTKNVTSVEGGMIVTADSALARRARLLRNQGMDTGGAAEIIGFNMRMTDVHAAVGRAQLRQLETRTRRRRLNAALLDEGLRGVIAPTAADGARHVYHQYTIRVPDHDRDAFADQLGRCGIGTGVYYRTPIHELPAYSMTADLPETRLAARSVLSLPVHPALSGGDLERIVEAVNSIAAAGA